jgi:hypothetical protein
MDNFMIAFILLLGFIFASRTINVRATKKLEPEKKAELIDLFSGNGILTFGILIGIVVIFLISLRFHLIDPLITYVIYIISLLCFIMITSYISYKKLRRASFPDSYIKSYILSTSLRFVGLLIFFAFLKY